MPAQSNNRVCNPQDSITRGGGVIRSNSVQEMYMLPKLWSVGSPLGVCELCGGRGRPRQALLLLLLLLLGSLGVRCDGCSSCIVIATHVLDKSRDE